MVFFDNTLSTQLPKSRSLMKHESYFKRKVESCKITGIFPNNFHFLFLLPFLLFEIICFPSPLYLASIGAWLTILHLKLFQKIWKIKTLCICIISNPKLPMMSVLFLTIRKNLLLGGKTTNIQYWIYQFPCWSCNDEELVGFFW